MNIIIIHSVKLLDALPDYVLKDAWDACVRMAKELATHGKINDPFLQTIDEFPVDDLISYAMYVSGAMAHRNIECTISEFNYWLYPTNKQNARYRLTYKNCKRYGLNRRSKHGFSFIKEPFTHFYGFGFVFNSMQEYKFISYLWTNNAITDYEWNRFNDKYTRLIECR